VPVARRCGGLSVQDVGHLQQKLIVFAEAILDLPPQLFFQVSGNDIPRDPLVTVMVAAVDGDRSVLGVSQGQMVSC